MIGCSLCSTGLHTNGAICTVCVCVMSLHFNTVHNCLRIRESVNVLNVLNVWCLWCLRCERCVRHKRHEPHHSLCMSTICALRMTIPMTAMQCYLLNTTLCMSCGRLTITFHLYCWTSRRSLLLLLLCLAVIAPDGQHQNPLQYHLYWQKKTAFHALSCLSYTL